MQWAVGDAGKVVEVLAYTERPELDEICLRAWGEGRIPERHRELDAVEVAAAS